MPDYDYFRTAYAQFRFVGPQINLGDLDVIFPDPFPGRDDLIEFYLRHNGGCRSEKGGVIHCGNPDHQITRETFDQMTVEGFFSISLDPEDRMLPCNPMLRSHATDRRIYKDVPEMKAFFDRHMPIAFDHSGNRIYIDTQSGEVRLLMWDTWKHGPIYIAGNFREFVSKFWNRAPGIELHL